MNAERVIFNLIILFLVVFVFNKYIITQKTALLMVLAGQFFSLILSITTFINNVKPNLIMEVIISVFGVVIPGLIFFYYYSERMEPKFKNYYDKVIQILQQGKKIEIDESFLLDDGSIDKYELGQKISPRPEKSVDDLLRGYNCPLDEIPQSVRDGYVEASKLIELKAWRKAMEIYLRIEKQCGENAVLQFNIGNMYLHLKEIHKAIGRFTNALAINQGVKAASSSAEDASSNRIALRRIKLALKKVDDYEIIFNHAVCLVCQGKYEKAIEMFKEAGESKENWMSIYQPLAVIYEAVGKNSQACEMYESLARLCSDDFEVQKKAGDFLCKIGDAGKAKLYYEKANNINPNYIDGYIKVGDILLNSGNFKEATEMYKLALNISPEHSEVYYNLGNAYYGNGQKLLALNEYKKAIELDASDYKSHYNVGVILDEMDMKEEAVHSFENALNIKPDFYDASNNLSVVLCSLNRYDDAIKNYLKALQYNPSSLELYFDLAVTLEYQQKFDQAEELYKKIIKINPQYSDAYLNLGLIRLQAEDLKNAELYFRKAADSSPDNHKAYYQLAKLYAVSREYGRCIEYLKKSVSLSDEYVEKVRTDHLFDSIRNLKGFECLVS